MVEQPERKHHLIEQLEERRERHRTRHIAVRAGVVVAGALITLAGIVMTGPVPGPGIVVIPIGLALLALEFTWAERLLEKAVDYADRAADAAKERTRGQKIAAGIATLAAIAASVAAAVFWDIPLLPV